jgi:PAS domain S-box-containing protein
MGVLVCHLADPALDDSLSLVFANEAAARLLARDLGEQVNRRLVDIFPAAGPAEVRAYAEVARQRAAPEGPASRDGAPDGTRVPPGTFSRVTFPLPERCVAIVFDRVTDDRQAAQQVRTLNAFLDSIIENIPAKVFVKDAETLRFERLNRACETLLGLPREKLLGRNDFDLFPREQAEFFQAKDREALEGRTLVDIPEEPMTAPDGTRRWLHTKKIPILDAHDQPRYLLGISYDITERKHAQVAHDEATQKTHRQLEEELRHSQKMEAIGRLAGGIAHDFNNLLSIILSYSSMMMDSLGANDPMRAEAEQIAIAGQRARDLTRQLLAFSRRQMMVPEVLNLDQVVRGIEPMLQRVLGEDVELDIPTGPATSVVMADRGQIQQIIMNLVVNARDAMPEGGKLSIKTANVALSDEDVRNQVGARPGPHVELSVSDTGEGMPDDVRPHIFEPFFTTKPTGKGTGLGLSTVLGIAQQSGGHVAVETAVGSGSTFRIFLPVAEAADAEASAAAPPKTAGRPKATRKGGTETILLVEDEGQLRVLARDILRGAGYDVMDAPNAASAVRLAETRSGPIHLLLTDVVMPHVSGRELARRLTIDRPRMKVLYMSGYDDAIVQRSVVDRNIAFLQKPITPDILLRKVREVLD